MMCSFCARPLVVEDVEFEGQVVEACADCARKIRTKRRSKNLGCFCPDDCPFHYDYGSY